MSRFITHILRHTQKNFISTTINLLGLTLGMVSFFLIAEYVGFELSFNRFNDKAESVYRVYHEPRSGEVEAYTSPGFPVRAKSSITGVSDVVRIAEGANLGEGLISIEQSGQEKNSFRETNFAYADGNVFEVFSFPILSGNQSGLMMPNTVAISRAASIKYFGDKSAIGNSITLNNQFGQTTYRVETIYEIPANSDLLYDLIFSLETLKNPANLGGNEMWASLDGTGSQWLHSYVMIDASRDIASIEKEMSTLFHQLNTEAEGEVKLMPLTDLHLGRMIDDPFPTTGKLSFIYILTFVGLIIMLIAWFNYVNLSSAGALKRAKEVGIRKVVGAGKSQLIAQFLGESVVLNLIALILAIAFANVLQLVLQSLVSKPVDFNFQSNQKYWMLIGAVLISGTLVSGLYTAFMLAAFKPQQILKGTFATSAGGVFIRKSLVVFQFTTSIVLIVTTLVLFNQLRFMRNKDLGINVDQLLVIRGAEIGRDGTFRARSSAFENEIGSISAVKSISRSGGVPLQGYNFATAGLMRNGAQPEDEKTSYNILSIDDRYLEVYGASLVAGNNFTTEMLTPWNEMKFLILNESAASKMGFESAEQAIGQKIKWGEREFEVRGVMKDYHHQSLQYAIEPVVFVPATGGGYYTVKLASADIAGTMSALEKIFKSSFPGNPFEFQFVDDAFANRYESELQNGYLFTAAASLAIFIGCLGLFGLANFSMEQKTKEIGIRKILGANISQIVNLLSKDFMLLVVVAFVIAVPLGWWTATRWLESFAYRVDVGVWVFVAGGTTAFLIAGFTVGFQAWKGATANPVKSIRHE